MNLIKREACNLKENYNSKATLKLILQNIKIIFGVCFIVFFALSVIAGIVGKYTDVVIVSLLFIAIGIYIIFSSWRKKKFINKFRLYVSILRNDPSGSIDNIASQLNTSVDVVKLNLEKMIQKSYFRNVLIDYDNNQLFIPGVTAKINPFSRNTGKTDINSSQYIVINCKNCGGSSKVYENSDNECEFCGTPISNIYLI